MFLALKKSLELVASGSEGCLATGSNWGWPCCYTAVENAFAAPQPQEPAAFALRGVGKRESSHQSVNQSIYWCPGGQLGPDRQKVQFSEAIQSKFASLHAKHSSRKLPHAFGSQKDIKSAIVHQCCKRSRCYDLIWLYAGQSKTKCCSSSTQFNDLHTRHSLFVLSEWTPSAQRPVSTPDRQTMALNQSINQYI